LAPAESEDAEISLGEPVGTRTSLDQKISKIWRKAELPKTQKQSRKLRKIETEIFAKVFSEFFKLFLNFFCKLKLGKLFYSLQLFYTNFWSG